MFPQPARSSDDLEGDFRADPAEDNVGVEAFVCGCKFPYRGAGFTVCVCFLGGEPYRCGLFGSDHEVGVVAGTEHVCDGGETAVSVRGEVDACCGGLKVEDCTDEGGVLVRVAVVFLSRPGAGFEVV